MIVNCSILVSIFKMIFDLGVFTSLPLNGGWYFALGYPKAETVRVLGATKPHFSPKPVNSAHHLT